MEKNIKELYFDLPINYKELQIYPVTMENYLEFHTYVSCLLLDKNSVPDAEIISMSYLRYLYKLAASGEAPYLYMLRLLLILVLKLDEHEEIGFYVDRNNKNKALFKIRGIEYNADDFDNIVDIIFEQNCISHIDESIQKEVRDALDAAEKFKMAQNANKICSLEEQMICVLISTPLKMEDIFKLTIRKFQKILKRVDAKMHYQIYLSASMSGMVKFKNENDIQHWMNDLSKKDEYSDVKVDMNEMNNKINNINQ